MEVTVYEGAVRRVAVVRSGAVLLETAQDALDWMSTLRHEYGCEAAVIGMEALTPRFFDLSTRVAGEMLQKFTNYRFPVAIAGDFDAYPGKSLKAFIRESNKGRQVLFLPDAQEAARRLGEF